MEAAVCRKSAFVRRWFYGVERCFCSCARSFWISRAEETAASAAAGSSRVCLNTATPDELLTLPGVGEKTAERILAYRDTYGKFVTVEQLLDVEGIGEGLLEKLRPYVYVEEIE